MAYKNGELKLTKNLPQDFDLIISLKDSKNIIDIIKIKFENDKYKEFYLNEMVELNELFLTYLSRILTDRDLPLKELFNKIFDLCLYLLKLNFSENYEVDIRFEDFDNNKIEIPFIVQENKDKINTYNFNDYNLIEGV